MTIPSLTRAQVREVDRIASEEFGIPGLVLMENAGLLATLELLAELRGDSGPVEVVCGGGNNGGDGYVIARQLAIRGRAVRILSTRAADDLGGDARVQRAIADAMGIEVTDVTAGSFTSAAPILVDALLGTGFRGQVRSPEREVIAGLVNSRRAGARVVAIDVPSGLDVDTGRPADPTVRADLTLTFVARKVGFDAPGAREFTGEVRVLPIGAPPAAIERAVARFPHPPDSSR